MSPEVDNRKRESTIARGEYDPYFDQNFKFPVSRDQLQGKELILQVMDCDRYSQNDAMGEVKINIDDVDLTNSVEVLTYLYIISGPFERVRKTQIQKKKKKKQQTNPFIF